MQSREIVEPILDAIRFGTSITTLVESVIETAVMEGEHSIDVGILASPVIVEYLRQAASVANIDYNLSDAAIKNNQKETKIDNRLLEEVLKEMEEEEESPVAQDIEESAKEIKKSSKGLMARANKDTEDGI